MGFFADKSSQDEQANNWARKLRDMVIGHGHVCRLSVIPDWAMHFVRLRKAVGAADIDKVLDWYAHNIGKEYVPRVFSAPSFRAKFDALKAAMARDTDAPEGEISQRNKDSAVALSNEYPFPVEILTALPKIIQKTRDNWKEFCNHITEHHMPPKAERGDCFMLMILDTFSPSFVQDWIIFISKRYGNQQHYTGPVMSLAWHKDAVAFKESFWRQWSLSWSGDPHTFDPLLDQLIKKNK